MQKNYILFMGCLVLAFMLQAQPKKAHSFIHGAAVRGDSTKKEVALVFTADEFGEGLSVICKTLHANKIKGSLFFTGRFFRNASFRPYINQLQRRGHYIGPHSDEHLLYNDWVKRDSLLVSRDSFLVDLANNIAAMKALSLPAYPDHFFIPPYEWWNDSITVWSKAAGFRLFSFTPGMRTAADYTYPEMGVSYKSSQWILDWLKDLLTKSPQKLYGAIILVHAGTDPRRPDKLYDRLQEMITMFRLNGFAFRRVDELLN